MLPQKNNIKPKRQKTPQQALSSLMRQCARAERSSGDALRLMRNWEIEPEKQQEILQRLIRDRFIDDRRYAEAFVREKTSLSVWGEYKIRAALKRKGIAESIINEVMRSSDSLQDTSRLEERLRSKIRTTKYKTTYELKTKLIRYALSLGFSMDCVMDVVERVTQTIANSEECEDTFF